MFSKNLSKFLVFFLVIGIASCSTENSLENTGNYLSTTDSYSPSNLGNSPEDLYGEQGEQYNEYIENNFIPVSEQAVSTFSVDADGASYSNTRRFLNNGLLPTNGAVRIEELINYFPLDYVSPSGNHPISLNGEISSCPWTPGHKLVRIGIQGEHIPKEELLPSNIVLLIDVSGSMGADNRLNLLKQGFNLLVDGFDQDDKIAIVTYASENKLVLEATSGNEKNKIKDAINGLGSGGGTAGAAGIETAYEIATANFVEGGNNRVIIGTDGDFNIGASSTEELVAMIEEKRELGIFITVLGVGNNNYNDGMLEQIANNGNGTYEYIDHINQAQKVFVEDFGKFYTVAKDVKVQIEFNPEIVESYRLIGYENRLLNQEDFEDDEKDAGEIGAGQNITALYEIIPVENGDIANLEALTIDFRYKLPNQDQSSPIALSIKDLGKTFEEASENHRFTSSVAGFGMMLIDSKYKGNLSYNDLINWVNGSRSFDPNGHRTELASLIELAESL